MIFGPAPEHTPLGTPPMSDSPWSLLPAASTNAEALDTLYIFFWVLCAISLVIAIGAPAFQPA